MTVLSLTWESPYLGKTVFILRWALIFMMEFSISQKMVCIEFRHTWSHHEQFIHLWNSYLSNFSEKLWWFQVPLCGCDPLVCSHQGHLINGCQGDNWLPGWHQGTLFTSMVDLNDKVIFHTVRLLYRVSYNLDILNTQHTPYRDGLVQDCSISSALALEILQPCAKPLI